MIHHGPRVLSLSACALALLSLVPSAAFARQDEPRDPPAGEPRDRGERGPGGPGGGFGGPGQAPERKLVAPFDKDGDGRLSREERAAAREFLREEAKNRPEREGPGGFGPPGGGADAGPGGGRGFRGGPPGMERRNATPPKPGAKVAPADVKSFPDAGLFDPTVLRTFFLEFEGTDWEKELVDFHGTDVEVPARLSFDGKSIDGVGVRFRGASSYFMVGDGYKRSLNLSVDFTDGKARALGARTLNLLNSNGDPSFLRAVLYSHIARKLLPAPDVNLVRLVINGEDWGVYANAEQFNKDFLKKWFPSADGVRWKVPGSPRGGGGLVYQGDDVASYQRQYEIKTDDPKEEQRGWAALIELCRTIDRTPPDELESALASRLDVDGALRFLALENATMNSDGYWIRASDFSLFLDEKGVFHVVPHDMNECFQPAEGPGMGRRGPRGDFGGGRFPPPPPEGAEPGAGVPGKTPESGERPADGAGAPLREGREGRAAGIASVDPLAGADDPRKPLLSKLLAVPAWRERYLGYVADIAERWLDWKALEPVVSRATALIADEVAADTRKLDSTEAFRIATGLAPGPTGLAPGPTGQPPAEAGDGPGPGRGPRRSISLRQFVEERRAFLLAHPEIAKVRAPKR